MTYASPLYFIPLSVTLSIAKTGVILLVCKRIYIVKRQHKKDCNNLRLVSPLRYSPLTIHF